MGGAYGGKAVPNQLVACAIAVAANKVNKPVRLVIDLQTNMEMFGKRDAYLGQYKVRQNIANELPLMSDYVIRQMLWRKLFSCMS